MTDGRSGMDNNPVARAIRPIALNRKNSLFAGHDAGAANWGVIDCLIVSSKPNTIDPRTYLTDTLQPSSTATSKTR